MNFERGQNIHKSLRIGKFKDPEPGDHILVRFLLRKSCPEYYPLQQKERDGKLVEATIREVLSPWPKPNGNISHISCIIEGLSDPFYSVWSKKEEVWIVGEY